MEWSNKLILEFLDLYEQEPCIWNPKHNKKITIPYMIREKIFQYFYFYKKYPSSIFFFLEGLLHLHYQMSNF